MAQKVNKKMANTNPDLSNHLINPLLKSLKTAVLPVPEMDLIDLTFKNETITASEADIKRCARYVAPLKLDEIVPKAPREVASFKLVGATPEMANAIRRVLIDELDVLCLTFDDADFLCTDPYILSDSMKKAIELIPIYQHLDRIKNPQISLKIDNLTEEPRLVFAKDISVTAPKTGAAGENAISPSDHMIITRVQSGKKLEIRKFKLIRGKGLIDSGKFSAVANVAYRDITPGLEQKPVMSKPPSGRTFEIEFTTHRNVPATTVLSQCLGSIEQRLAEVGRIFGEIPADFQVSFHSDDLSVELLVDDFVKIILKKENRTITDLLAKYIYLEDPQITFVASASDHYMINFGAFIRLKHGQWRAIFAAAIERAQAEVGALALKVPRG